MHLSFVISGTILYSTMLFDFKCFSFIALSKLLYFDCFFCICYLYCFTLISFGLDLVAYKGCID